VPTATAPPHWQRTLAVLTGTVVAVAVVALLYWAQAVLIPVALGVLCTFVLTPPVGALQRRGLGRIPSVGLVVLLAAVALGGVGWLVTDQVAREGSPRRRGGGPAEGDGLKRPPPLIATGRVPR
jgi:predicted PurR-regulated permease PerM